MKRRLLILLFCQWALLVFASMASGQPTFVQTPAGEQTSFWTYPNTWSMVKFTVTASKSDGPGITDWSMSPLPDGASVTGMPPGEGDPHDEVTWRFSWTPTHDHQGSAVLTFTAADGNGDGFHHVILNVERKDLPTEPTDYTTIYDDIENNLDDFEAYLGSSDPAVSQTQPPAPLMWGQTVVGTEAIACFRFLSWNVDHYEPNSYYIDRMKDQIDKHVAMGVGVIKMNIGYPLHTDAFQEWASETILDWTYEEIGCQDIHKTPGRWGAVGSGATGDPEVWEHGVDVPWSKEDFILFYKELVDYIRSKGKKVYITHNTLKWQASNIQSLGYFDRLKEEEGWNKENIRARYREERSAEFALICKELRPDYALLLMEPEQQNSDFGDMEPPGGLLEEAPLFEDKYWPAEHPDYETCWSSYVDAAIASFKAIPGGPPPSDLGICMGTWGSEEAADSLIEAYAQHDDIDYFDWHVYPVKAIRDEGTPDEIVVEGLKNLINWTDRVQAINPNARFIVGECWLQKASAEEVGSYPPLSPLLVFGRDTYSFWAPLDQKYFRLIRDACKRKNFEILMPFFGTYYYYDYLTYDDLPSDYGAPYWNPPDGYDLQYIDRKCTGLAILIYFKDPALGTWWNDPETGRLPEGRLTLTGEWVKALGVDEVCNNGLDDDLDGQVDFAYDLDCDAVVGWLSGEGSLVARGSDIYRDLPDRLPISGTSVELSFGRYIDDHRSWRLITRSVDRVGPIVSALELEIEGDFSLVGEVDFELLIYSDGVGTYISGMRGTHVDLEKYSSGEQLIYKVNSGVLEVHGTFLAGGEWIVLENGEIIDRGSLYSGEYPPVPGGCVDADLDGFAVDGGDCGETDCDDDLSACGTACHPWHEEISGDEHDNDCDGFTDEPFYGDLGPFGYADGRWTAADFELSIDCIRSGLYFTGDQTVLIDVAPVQVCEGPEVPMLVAPNPDGAVNVDDLSVLLQAASYYVEIVPYCP